MNDRICSLQLDPPPEFLAQRQELWDRLKKEQDDWVAAQVPQPIKVTLPDGKVLDGESWKTTPYEIASGIRFVCQSVNMCLHSRVCLE